ncbi:Prolyl oligopeptidase family protein, partial [Zea mays]
DACLPAPPACDAHLVSPLWQPPSRPPRDPSAHGRVPHKPRSVKSALPSPPPQPAASPQPPSPRSWRRRDCVGRGRRGRRAGAAAGARLRAGLPGDGSQIRLLSPLTERIQGLWRALRTREPSPCLSRATRTAASREESFFSVAPAIRSPPGGPPSAVRSDRSSTIRQSSSGFRVSPPCRSTDERFLSAVCPVHR